MDLNTFLMRKLASSAGGPYNISNVKESNGWVYDPITKSAIPVNKYYRYNLSYGDENSVSLLGEDEFNQFASKYDGNTFDFQTYNSSGRDLGRYDARKENLDDAARRAAEAEAYENSAQWREYQEVMKRNNAANVNALSAGAPQNSVYGDSITPTTYNTGGNTASKPTGTNTATTSGDTPTTAAKSTAPTRVGDKVSKATQPKTPVDTGGHISRDQALMLLHQGYSPTSIGGWTLAYDSTLTGSHLAKMKTDPNYNPFSHYNKSQADRILKNSSDPETMNFNGTKYNLKDPLEARKYQAARAAYKATLDPNSAEYKRLFPSNNKRLIPAQIAKLNRYAANYGYIPGHLFNN